MAVGWALSGGCTGDDPAADSGTEPLDVADTDADADSDADTDTDTDADADSDADTDTDADADSDADADTDTDATGDTGSDLPEGPGVGGAVIGADGAPIASVQVLGCTATTCLSTFTGPAGEFWFDTAPDQTLALKVAEKLTIDPRRAEALEPATIVGSASVDVGVLYAPDLPDGVPWGPVADDPQTFDAGDGLVLTMNRADVTLAILQTFDDVAAVRIPDEYVPTYPDLGGEAVLDVFALHPFDAHSSSPIAVQVPTTLPPGAVAHVRSVDPLGGTLSSPALATSDGTFLVTDPGEGLWVTSYVVISVP